MVSEIKGNGEWWDFAKNPWTSLNWKAGLKINTKKMKKINKIIKHRPRSINHLQKPNQKKIDRQENIKYLDKSLVLRYSKASSTPL